MIIGIDASRAVMPRGAGVRRYSKEIISAMISNPKHTFRLYANGAERPDWAGGSNVEWRNLPLKRLWTHVRLATEMITRSPDALFVPAHVLPWDHPEASVATIHDLGFLHFPSCHPPLQRLYLKFTTRYNARCSARVLVDSEATRNDLARFFGVSPDQCVVAYPGVSKAFKPQPERAVSDLRKRLSLPEKYLLFVGTIQPRKNIPRLLRAHARIPQAPPLVVVGAAGWQSESILQAIHEASPRVLYLDYIKDEDMPAIMSGASALVLPSLYEGFGIPALEAMACGTPVVVSQTSSLPEVVGDAGILVDPLSEDSISDGILKALKDTALAQALKERGIDRAASFGWSSCAAQATQAIEQVYDQARSSNKRILPG